MSLAPAVLISLLLLAPAARTTPPGKAIRVELGAVAEQLSIAERAVDLDAVPAAIDAQLPATAIVLTQGEGSDLPGRHLLEIIDRLVRSGLPVRVQTPRSRRGNRVMATALAAGTWLERAPRAADICLAGALPEGQAIRGRTALLDVDLRTVVEIDGSGKLLALRSSPSTNLDQPAPGPESPSATAAVAVGETTTVRDVLRLLQQLTRNGHGRALLLLSVGDAGVVAGIPIALTPGGERPGPLPQRSAPPSRSSAPVHRAIRMLAEEGLLAMRKIAGPAGTMPEDDVFSAVENTALALTAFLGAGVRAGDGTPSGALVSHMERWLLDLPEETDRGRRRRQERAILAFAAVEAYETTRHPLLAELANRHVHQLAASFETRAGLPGGVVTGFEAMALARADRTGLEVSKQALTHFAEAVERTVDKESGEVVFDTSHRSSVDSLAVANALLLFRRWPGDDERLNALIGQGPSELPSPESSLANEKRALAAFFHARLAWNAAGSQYDRFNEMLKRSVPKAAPLRERDIEADETDEVAAPWSGGGEIHSVGRVALMTLAYEVPDRLALSRTSTRRRR